MVYFQAAFLLMIATNTFSSLLYHYPGTVREFRKISDDNKRKKLLEEKKKKADEKQNSQPVLPHK